MTSPVRYQSTHPWTNVENCTFFGGYETQVTVDEVHMQVWTEPASTLYRVHVLLSTGQST